MLFDTPGLNVAAHSIVGGSGAESKKRKSESEPKAEASAVNIDKLMKKMKNIHNPDANSPKPKKIDQSPKPKQPKPQQQQSQQQRAPKPSQPKQDGDKPQRWEPAKKDKRAAAQAKKDKKNKKNQPEEFASDANLIPTDRSNAWPAAQADVDAAAAAAATPARRAFTAPTLDDDDASASPAVPQSALQLSLRAKLAGGKFRMLNETLYTTTGAQAWETMKDEGAFDDYHAGFRGQAAGWPVQPIKLIVASLLASLGPNSLVADFGCGDAELARKLAADEEKKLKCVSYDLVSKDSWVVEAECSSVPLPGGRGGEIVDAVVCCLSLMGTDWIEIVREARRVLRNAGALKIAEVSSRFTDIDKFVSLVESVGFSLDSKDTSNTHFIMFDFTKAAAASSEQGTNTRARQEWAKKSEGLLRPCIYKKR